MYGTRVALLLVFLTFSSPALRASDDFFDLGPHCGRRMALSPATLLAAFAEMAVGRRHLDGLRNAVDRHFVDFPVDVLGRSVPISLYLMGLKVPHLELAIHAFARGHDGEALASLNELFRVFPARFGVAADAGMRRALTTQARAAADDPEVYRVLTLMEFILADAPSLDSFFLAPTFPRELYDLRAHRDPRTSFFGGRVQQLETVRAVLQYGTTRPGENVLEIGYRTVGSLLTLSRYLNRVNFVGVDVSPVPRRANAFLADKNIHLFEGNPPEDRLLAAVLRGKGPYSVIYATDVLFETTPAGRTYPFGVTNAAYLKWLHENLIDGGVVVLMNDYRRLPMFSRAEAQAAGFTIVRWDVPRVLGNRFLELSRAMGMPEKTGQMSLFVLRRGNEPVGRMEVRAEVR